MGTRVTIKGQVTIPKAVREAAGIQPGDEVEFEFRAGQITLKRSQRAERLDRWVERIWHDPPIKGVSTDEIMNLTRGEDR
ncbi:MAG TPA: AbrB/MazE/SpoVT family DNA-binding domain-containing protein [Beijerinckiaceae bacterium]